jgi:hypothetical protein
MTGQPRTAAGQVSGQWQEGGPDRTAPFKELSVVRPCLARVQKKGDRATLAGVGAALRYAFPLPSAALQWEAGAGLLPAQPSGHRHQPFFAHPQFRS